MAVVINGNGTVTGVTTLPDGIVTNDDLAGSIADSKITGLSASKLSGIVPAANLGTGSPSSSTFLNGAGAYAEAGGGAWTVISSTNITSSITSVDFTSLDGDTYQTYVMLISDLVQAVNNNHVSLRFYQTGTGWRTSNYYWHTSYSAATGITYWGNDGNSRNGIYITFQSSNDKYGATSAVVYITGLNTTIGSATNNRHPSVHGTYKNGNAANSNTPVGGNFYGSWGKGTDVTYAHDGIQVLSSGGNLTEGRVTLYGIKHS